MPADLGHFVQDLTSSLRGVDVIDVLLFAVLVYVAGSWFRQARSRFVMLGVLALLAVYAVARLLDLALTLVLFQVGVSVVLIALVVIFQEEIRRAFERLGNPGTLHKAKRGDAEDAWVDDVVGAVASMARSKTGALVVLQGREPLHRHLRGGVELGGNLSQPLLLSIFDSSSPGHDGAVLVQDGRVRSFGVHLPLSTHIAGDEGFGTRHTAALGLSERSDALVVVVSEERGEVSVAKDGQLEILGSPAEVGPRMRSFLASLAPGARASSWGSWTRNLMPKLLAFVVAAATWIVVVGPQGERVGRSYRVPVVLRHAPSRFMLDQPRPPEVLVTISGAERSFRVLDPASLSVTVEASEIRAGAQRVHIGQSSIELPRGLVLQRLDPETITLVARETIARSYPVHVVTEGKLPPGQKLTSAEATPPSVRLVVRKSEAGTFSRVDTEAVALPDLDGPATVTRTLSIPPGARVEAGAPSTVRVRLHIEPR